MQQDDEPIDALVPAGGVSDDARRALAAHPDAAPVLRFYVAFETGTADGLDAILTDDWLDVPLNPGQGPGRAGASDAIAGFSRAFADLRASIEEVVVSGSVVVVRTTMRGVHRGEFLGVPPTGRAVEFRTADVHHRADDGRIAISYHLEDTFSIYARISSSG